MRQTGNFGRAAQAHAVRAAGGLHRQAEFTGLPAHRPAGQAGGRTLVPVAGRPVRRAHRRTRESLERGVHAGRARLAHRATDRKPPDAAVPVRPPGQRPAGRRVRVARRFPGLEPRRARRVAAHHAVRPPPGAVRHHCRLVAVLAERRDGRRCRQTVRRTADARYP